MKAYLILEDGTVFAGTSIGSTKEVISEIVFNTSMDSYLDVLTDASNAGKTVVMTYPLIGNCGIISDEKPVEVWVDGIIVKEISRRASNFQCKGDLIDLLVEQEITGICGLDTRALVIHLREHGSMKGMITVNDTFDLDEVMLRLKEYKVENSVVKYTSNKKVTILGDKHKVAVLDLGSKKDIVSALTKRGCEIVVLSALSTAEEILSENPDGIVISTGPDHPKECSAIVDEIRKLMKTDLPMIGIGLGHLLAAIANGGEVYKLKNGHRGGNYPVKDLSNGHVYISAQNHGYEVDANSLDKNLAKETFVNVNDGTNEGLTYIGKNIFTVQFSPETCAGQNDLGYLYDKFVNMMEEHSNA